MSLPKFSIRLAVFFCTLTVALCITRLCLVPPRVEVKVLAPNPPPAIVSDKFAAEFLARTQLIELDRAELKAHIKLLVVPLVKPNSQPDRLWVWVYFFSPDLPGQVLASEPIEVRDPFAQSPHPTISLTIPCKWYADESSTLPRNFYARVNVSTESANAAILAKEQMNFDISNATPVVVEHERER
jgi:hypothetical protein